MIDVEMYRNAILAVLFVGAFNPRIAFAILAFLFAAHHWPLF
jgi:hypothetical protein